MRDQKDQNGSYGIRRIREESMGKRGGVKRGGEIKKRIRKVSENVSGKGWW